MFQHALHSAHRGRASMLAAIAVLAACAPTPPPPVVVPVRPDTATTVPTPPPRPDVMPQPAWEATTRDLVLAIAARDPASGTSDSTTSRLRLDLLPATSPGALVIRSRADTFPVRPPVTVTVDADGRLIPPLPIPTCPGTPGDVSPLQLRMVLPRAARSWPQADSLLYDTCVRGVRARVASQVTWAAPSFDAQRREWTQVLSVTGQLLADSTRALPMRLRGVLSGRGTLQLTADKLAVEEASGQLQLDLTAESSLKAQRVMQVVTYAVTRRP